VVKRSSRCHFQALNVTKEALNVIARSPSVWKHFNEFCFFFGTEGFKEALLLDFKKFWSCNLKGNSSEDCFGRFRSRFKSFDSDRLYGEGRDKCRSSALCSASASLSSSHVDEFRLASTKSRSSVETGTAISSLCGTCHIAERKEEYIKCCLSLLFMPLTNEAEATVM